MFENQLLARLIPFVSILVTMMVLETILPRRKRTESRVKRTFNNLSLTVVNSFVIKVLPILSAVAAATFAGQRGWGILNQFAWPAWLEYGIIIVLMDMLIYWQHVASHHIPALWHFHQVHHADHDLDASSGLRFHPIEIGFSMGIKCIAVILLGASPESVALFEIVLNGCAVFNHSNVKLPLWVDRILRLVLVTPDMHRVHHSVELDETNSNYGFNIPWWDRMFGTYRAQPRGEHANLKLGLPEYPNSRQTIPLRSMLVMPWRRDATSEKMKVTAEHRPKSKEVA